MAEANSTTPAVMRRGQRIALALYLVLVVTGPSLIPFVVLLFYGGTANWGWVGLFLLLAVTYLITKFVGLPGKSPTQVPALVRDRSVMRAREALRLGGMLAGTNAIYCVMSAVFPARIAVIAIVLSSLGVAIWAAVVTLVFWPMIVSPRAGKH